MSAAALTDAAISSLTAQSQSERWPYTRVADWIARSPKADIDLEELPTVQLPARFKALTSATSEYELPAGCSTLQLAVGPDWTSHNVTIRVAKGVAAEVVLLSAAQEQGQRHIRWDIAEEAQLKVYRIPQWAASATVFEHWNMHIGHKACVQVHELLLGQGMHRCRVQAKLEAENAQVHWQGLALLGGRTRAVLDLRVEHLAEHCLSRLDLRNALAGRSRRSAIGMVHVAREGQHTDSAQICRSLLLGKKASADMRPELEIFADQVQCAHGATCGELDQTALHYLRSRGLDQLTARRLLLESFALPLLKDWPEDLYQALEPALLQSMNELGHALASEVGHEL